MRLQLREAAGEKGPAEDGGAPFRIVVEFSERQRLSARSGSQ